MSEQDSAIRAAIDRLMPSLEELDALATPMPLVWLDDQVWDDYDLSEESKEN